MTDASDLGKPPNRGPSAASAKSAGFESASSQAVEPKDVRGPASLDLSVTAGPASRASQGPRDKPSRTAAMRRRHRRQLQRHTKDQAGVCVADTALPFSMWASPAAIGEACTGLGVLFTTLKWMAWLALVLSVLGIYPLAGNVANQQWGDTYALVADGAAQGTCPKPWAVGSWITATTAGARCASTIYSGPVDCAATCSFDPARALQPGCAGLATAPTPPQPAGDLAAACLLHRPCAEGADPAAPDGACRCCDLALDVAAVNAARPVSPGQLWVLVLGQVVVLGWLVFLVRAQHGASLVSNARVLTLPAYAVLIRGAKCTPQGQAPRPPCPHPGPGTARPGGLRGSRGRPEVEARPDPGLAAWCARWGAVVGAFGVPSVGSALRSAHQVQALQIRLAEAEALAAERSCSAFRWLYRLLALGGTASGVRRRLGHETLKLSVYQRHALEPTGTALAVFAYASQAQACEHANRRSVAQRLGDAVLCGRRRDWGCCASAAPLLAGARVRVARAPEPSDIIWEHTSCTGAQAAARRAWSLVLTAGIVAAGAGLQYGLAVAAERQRTDMMQSLRSADDTPSLDFSSLGSLLDSAMNNSTFLRALSVLSGLAVVTVNWAITLAVRRLSVYERWHTRTSLERWVTCRLALSYLLNATAVPLLAAYLSGSTSGWYSRGGLVESAFYTQVANAVLVPAVMVCDPLPLLRAHVLSRCARTQAMMDALLAPPDFPLAEEAAGAIKTLGMAMFWAPVLPPSLFLAAIGLFLAYWADKWVALRRAASPGNLGGSALAGVVGPWLRALPLVQLVLIRFLYFKDYGSAVPVFWTGLALWLLFLIAPLRHSCCMHVPPRTCAAGALPYWETLGAGSRAPGGADGRFAPRVPASCSREFRDRVEAAFAMGGMQGGGAGALPPVAEQTTPGTEPPRPMDHRWSLGPGPLGSLPATDEPGRRLGGSSWAPECTSIRAESTFAYSWAADGKV